MVAIHSMESCLDCRFWHRGDVMGQCKRYPEHFNKHQNDWCGEYVKIPSPTYAPVVAKRGRPAKGESNEA